MVIEQVQDFDVGAVGELPMGRVGLPHLIGQLGLEANPGGLRALVWLRLNQAVGLEDPPDGRPRGGSSEAKPEVVGDGLGAGIEANVCKLAPQVDDGLLNLRGGPARA